MTDRIELHRVVVNEAGEAVPLRRARQMGIEPTVAFVRDDGWTLAAPAHLVHVAEKMWLGMWIRRVEL
jgi:hypothetical protein